MPRIHPILTAPALMAMSTSAVMSFTALSQDVTPTGEQLVKVTAVSAVEEIHAGEWFLVAFRFEIAPHWHIYWTNPGDSGAPTVIEVKAPKDYEVGEILWPAPRNIPGPFITYGYEESATLFVPVRAPETLRDGDVTLTAAVEWMVCREECLLGGTSVSVIVRTTEGSAPPAPGDRERQVTITAADGTRARKTVRLDSEQGLSAFERLPLDLREVRQASIERTGRRIVITGPAPGVSEGALAGGPPRPAVIEFFPSPTPGVAMRVVEQVVTDGRFRLVLDTMVSPNNTRGVPPEAAGVIAALPVQGGKPVAYAFRLRLDTDEPMSKDDQSGQ